MAVQDEVNKMVNRCTAFKDEIDTELADVDNTHSFRQDLKEIVKLTLDLRNKLVDLKNDYNL